MLVGFGAVLVPAGRSVAEPDPARVCAVSDQLIKAGYLTEARALFNRLPDEAPVPCMAADLQRIDLRKAAAAAAVRKGQQQLAEKKNEAAAKSFEAALAEERDNAEARAGHTAATAEKAPSKGLSEEKEDWDDFYHDWLVPLLQLIAAALIGIVVLGALSGLFAHWVVRPQSVVWHRAARSVIGTLGVVLILGCGVMMPLYAMYRPFAPQTVVADPAGLAFLIPALAVLIAVAQAAATSPTRLMRPQSWAPWWRLLLATAAVIGAGLLAWLTVMSDPLERLLVAYAVLSCFGVVLTAAALGQNLRLQVEAQKTEGTADAVATDYLLARLRALGTERPPQGLTAVPAVTSLSSLRTEDLSALPAGKVAGALSRLFFALRPDLTWRARVVLVDANRIAVTLTRNGHHAESTIFSRLDLGLPAVEEEEAEDRLRAQLLTGAAAIILVRLSHTHPELQASLCGARDWRSVTLQVIASSASLIDSPDERIPMLGRAIHEDPNYTLARLEYLWAHQITAPLDSTLFRQICTTTDRLLGGLTDASSSGIRIRGYYRNTAQWINMYAQGGYTDRTLLRRARRSFSRLDHACRTADQHAPAAQLADRARPLTDIFRSIIEALSAPHAPAPVPRHPTQFLSPRVAYENACLDCALLETGPAPKRDYATEAEQHLQIGMPTSSDVQHAITDPCLAALRQRPGYQSLVGTPPTEFLKVRTFTETAFKGTADKLDSAGLSHPEEIIRNTTGTRGRTELAEYLTVSPLLVDRIRQIALLTRTHPDLADPRMLNLLLGAEIESPTRLRAEARKDPEALMARLRELAAAEGASALQGIQHPEGWLRSATGHAAGSGS
ncbi:hypothetical protein ACFY8X_26870 [Streptomyces tanashiensis]|uniref:hypothetical protein n=1 Tax=Streptomyces tanashiensis TaxID=67367 RepID=UPI00167E6B28|nr:hypothetical protein [Streptomyces tanashiensis]